MAASRRTKGRKQAQRHTKRQRRHETHSQTKRTWRHAQRRRKSTKRRSPQRGGYEKTTAFRNKVRKVMHEYKYGRLRSGSKRGPVLRSRQQAIAIALSEARKR